jgi:hypothetical protein
MFIRKWRTPEWAMLSIGFGLLLLVVILSLAPSADAAPLQAPPTAGSCKDFPNRDRTMIKLPGVKNNDSCVAAWLEGCRLQVEVFINGKTSSDLKTYTVTRIVYDKDLKTKRRNEFNAMTKTTTNGYSTRSLYFTDNHAWDVPDCNKKRPQFDWSTTVWVKLQTLRGTVRANASHDAGHISDEIDGAVIFP